MRHDQLFVRGQRAVPRLQHPEQHAQATRTRRGVVHLRDRRVLGRALLGLGALATWCVMLFFFRISSLSALVTALFAPLWFWLLFGLQPMLLAVLLIAALLLWRHRANIGRLLRGEEKRVGNR